MPLLRTLMLQVSRQPRIKQLMMAVPATRGVVARFVSGEDVDHVIEAVRDLHAKGLWTSIDSLGEDTTDVAMATAVTEGYVALLERLRAEGLSDRAEVSVKLSAVGLFLADGGQEMALANARLICRAARNAGTTVTLDMEDHTTVDATLAVLAELRRDFPDTGCVLQAYLFRTAEDAAAQARIPGARVRLCKGAYQEPASVAHQEREEVDKAFVRALKVLMAGEGYPMVASHDPRLVDIAADLAQRNGRGVDDFEFQMLYGIRPLEQERLANLGHKVRVYVPFGTDWYGYFTRRLAERPANILFFLRSFVGRR